MKKNIFPLYLLLAIIQTGKTFDAFKKPVEKKGFLEKYKLKSTVKAAEILARLKKEYELRYGLSPAIYALLKGIKT
jgi:hypothetical protein